MKVRKYVVSAKASVATGDSLLTELFGKSPSQLMTRVVEAASFAEVATKTRDFLKEVAADPAFVPAKVERPGGVSGLVAWVSVPRGERKPPGFDAFARRLASMFFDPALFADTNAAPAAASAP